MLDNWSIHKTKEVKIKLTKLTKAIYMLLHSLRFTPIKLFFVYLNINLKWRFKSQIIKLNLKESLSFI